MGDIKNLVSQEATDKIKELATAANICFFTTRLSEQPVHACPMATIKADDEGNLWFFSKDNSEKNEDIRMDAHVQLYYLNISSSEYLSIYGEAIVQKDTAKAKELWTPIAKAWFPDGVDDPALTIIKVTPKEAYYWDTKHGKMFSLLKIAASVVSGKESDDGIEGTLKP